MLYQLSVLINFTAVVQAIILIMLLLRKKYVGYVYNRFLAILLMAFSIAIINSLRVLLGYEYEFEFYETISNSMGILVPPTIYLYVKTKLDQSVDWVKPILLHGIPFLTLISLSILFLVFSIDYLDQLENAFIPIYLGQNIIYLTLSYRLVRDIEKSAKGQFNSQSVKSLLWMKQILVSYSIVFVMSLISIGFTISGNQLPDYINLNFILILSLHIIVLGYRNISESDVLFKEVPYSKSQLSDEKSREIFKEIRRLFSEEKIFRSKDLTLAKLAKELGISSSYISQSINREKEVSFSDFINQYRVEDVKSKLHDKNYSHLTLLGIAESAGFKSGSVFNTAFKKQTGVTPSQFKKSISSKN